MIVELYRAMWESDSGSAAQFQAFSTVAEALDWLGRACDVEKIWPDIAGAPVEGLRSAR